MKRKPCFNGNDVVNLQLKLKSDLKIPITSTVAKFTPIYLIPGAIFAFNKHLINVTT